VPDELERKRKARTQWISCTIKLNCHCCFDIPVGSYGEINPEDTYKCSNHGDQYVLRVSRLGKS